MNTETHRTDKVTLNIDLHLTEQHEYPEKPMEASGEQ